MFALTARGEEYLPGVERRDPLPSVLGQTEAVERRGTAHQKPHSGGVTGSTEGDSVGPRNVTRRDSRTTGLGREPLKGLAARRKAEHCRYWALPSLRSKRVTGQTRAEEGDNKSVFESSEEKGRR